MLVGSKWQWLRCVWQLFKRLYPVKYREVSELLTANIQQPSSLFWMDKQNDQSSWVHFCTCTFSLAKYESNASVLLVIIFYKMCFMSCACTQAKVLTSYVPAVRLSCFSPACLSVYSPQPPPDKYRLVKTKFSHTRRKRRLSSVSQAIICDIWLKK